MAAEPCRGEGGCGVQGAGLAEEENSSVPGTVCPRFVGADQVEGLADVGEVLVPPADDHQGGAGRLAQGADARQAGATSAAHEGVNRNLSCSRARARTAAALPVPLATRPIGRPTSGGWWRSHSNRASMRWPRSGVL